MLLLGSGAICSAAPHTGGSKEAKSQTSPTVSILMHMRRILSVLIAATFYLLCQGSGIAGGGDTSWMLRAQYGLFMHYQYRILLGYSIATKPSFPKLSQMSASEWNRFVDGFDVKGFAQQMADAEVGWVMFCIDDHYFAWPCAPNKAFSDYTGYAPGEKCSRRDLILDMADALNAKGVKLICYFAGLNGYMKEPKVSAGLRDGTARGTYNEQSPPSADWIGPSILRPVSSRTLGSHS